MRTTLGWKRHLILDTCAVAVVVTHFVYPGHWGGGYADALASVAVMAVMWSLWRESRAVGPYADHKGPFSTD